MRAFTLIELLLVLGLLVLILSLTAPVAINHYQSYQIIAERDNILGLLRRARSLSIANRNAAAHGVYFDMSQSQYVIFEGSSYALRAPNWDEVFSWPASLTITGQSEVVFAPLAATTTGVNIALSNSAANFNIQINDQGGILW